MFRGPLEPSPDRVKLDIKDPRHAPEAHPVEEHRDGHDHLVNVRPKVVERRSLPAAEDRAAGTADELTNPTALGVVCAVPYDVPLASLSEESTRPVRTGEFGELGLGSAHSHGVPIYISTYKRVTTLDTIAAGNSALHSPLS